MRVTVNPYYIRDFHTFLTVTCQRWESFESSSIYLYDTQRLPPRTYSCPGVYSGPKVTVYFNPLSKVRLPYHSGAVPLHRTYCFTKPSDYLIKSFTNKPIDPQKKDSRVIKNQMVISVTNRSNVINIAVLFILSGDDQIKFLTPQLLLKGKGS